jgi:3-oxoacyl-[acyl-carrier protein] reductase
VRLTGKVAVITGGARGIGGATAALFTREGAKVIVGDLLTAEGEALVQAIQREGGDAAFVQTDVTRESDCAALMARAGDVPGRIDALVCCAGILRGAFVAADVLDEATFARVAEVNVTGTFLCVKQAVPWLRRAADGVILLLASGAGVRSPSSSLAYGASKGGVHGFAMTLEAQLAPLGIRVNDVCPGAIDTDMKRTNVVEAALQTGRPADRALAESGLGDPLGVARVLAFLASSDADFVRGTIFTR